MKTGEGEENAGLFEISGSKAWGVAKLEDSARSLAYSIPGRRTQHPLGLREEKSNFLLVVEEMCFYVFPFFAPRKSAV